MYILCIGYWHCLHLLGIVCIYNFLVEIKLFGLQMQMSLAAFF